MSPTPWTTPFPPPPDDFERCLGELSNEYQRLRMWSKDLARDNARLRTANNQEIHGMTSVPESFPPFGLSFETDLAIEATPKRPVQTAVPFLATTLPDPPKLKEEPIEWRSEDVATTAGGRSGEFTHSTVAGSATDLAPPFCANRSLANDKLNRSNSLQEQFERLAGGAKRVKIANLLPVLQEAGEPVHYPSLISLVRVSNGLRPLEPCENLEVDLPDGEVDAELGIDLHAWREIMEETNTFDRLGPLLKNSIKSLRIACLQEETKHTLEMLEGNAADDTDGVRSKESFKKKREKQLRRLLWMEIVPTVVIILNAIFTGVAADYDGPAFSTIWDFLEALFFTFYSCEFICKLWIFGCGKYFCGPDRMWNIFDFICLIISAAEMFSKLLFVVAFGGVPPDMGPLLLIKVFRLTRLARPLRTLRFKLLYELKLIVMGVFSGLRVLFWAIVLLTVLTYLVGVATTLLFKEAEEEFASVLRSMFTLFRCWTDGCESYDGRPLPERLRERYGVPFMIFHVLVTTFVTIGVFNLIMAIFIDNVVTAQARRRHTELGQRTHEIELKIKKMIATLIKESAMRKNSTFRKSLSTNVQRSLDNLEPVPEIPDSLAAITREWAQLREKGVTISREVLNKWFQNDDFQYLLEQAEIETANTGELFDVLDADMGGHLSMDELITGLMKLRGPVTKADIVAVRLKVRNLTRILENDDIVPEQA